MIIRNALFITGKEVWLGFTVDEVRGACVCVTEVELTPHTERCSSLRRLVLSNPKNPAENCCWHCTTTCVSIPQSRRSISAHANTRSCHCHLLSEQSNNGTDHCEWSNLSFCFYTSCICIKNVLSGCVTRFGIAIAMFCWTWFESHKDLRHYQILYRPNSLNRSMKWITFTVEYQVSCGAGKRLTCPQTSLQISSGPLVELNETAYHLAKYLY